MTTALQPNNPDTAWGVSHQDSIVCDETISDFEVEDEGEVDIAIIGGGLAGLAAAIGLGHSGIDVSIKLFEKAPTLRSDSQGMLVLFPQGMAALKVLDKNLPDQIAKAGSEARRIVFKAIQSEGEVLEKSFPWPFRSHEYSSVFVQWHALQKVLASDLPDGVVCTGRSFHSYEEENDSVVLTFNDTSDRTSERRRRTRVRCKAVLACDGNFSSVRRQMYPHDKPIYFGQLNWNAIVPMSSLPKGTSLPNTSKIVVERHDEPKLHIFVNDCGGGNTFWQLRIDDPEKALAVSGNSGRGGLGLVGTKERLLSVVQGRGDGIEEAIRLTPEKDIFERCIVARSVVSESWCSKLGRVALVGDAAHGMHPFPGLGGNSVFESVSVVVQELINSYKIDAGKKNDDWIRNGLQAYESKRRFKADLIQRHSNFTGATTFTQGAKSQKRPPYVGKTVMDWIHATPADASIDFEEHAPPIEAIDFLNTFDPCSISRVSMI